MAAGAGTDLLERIVRASDAYELVPYERLPPSEQLTLAELRSEPDFYGVLRARGSRGGTIKAVDRDTALLWLTLREPGPLPAFFHAGNAAAGRRRLASLVLDDVLELEDGGQFFSGPAALQLVDAQVRPAPDGRIQALSLEALRYAQSLRLDDPEQLAARLYGYGTLPVTAAWARRTVDPDAVLALLGATGGGPTARQLRSGWRHAQESPQSGWHHWSRGESRLARDGAPVFKLYVSVMPDQLAQAFAAVVDTLSALPNAQFKVGADAGGLLRPDHLVIYFGDQDALHQLAGRLARALDGLPARGVPFTAGIALDGALSWGVDPPAAARALAWQASDSWRLWVVRRLAAALVLAGQSGVTEVAPWQFALGRLQLQEVDVDRWCPTTLGWWDA